MTEQSVLHVVYASSDQYAKYLGISLVSLLQSNTAFARVECSILDSGIGEENRQKLQTITDTYHCGLSFYPIGNIGETLGLQGAALAGAAMYARLLMASLLPREVTKVLYLDCDTLVTDSLEALWETPLAGAYVAGVQDTVDMFFQTVIDLAPGVPYLNAGVLLINLERWRADDLQARFAAFINRFNGQVPFHDQGILNGVCGAERVLLPLRFNMTSNLYSFSTHTIERIYFIKQYYSQPELDAARRSPAIVHFTSGLVGRPWEEGCTHPEQERFLHAMQATPWIGEPLAPRTLALKTRLFTFYYNHVPRKLFETSYRLLGWLRHIGH